MYGIKKSKYMSANKIRKNKQETKISDRIARLDFRMALRLTNCENISRYYFKKLDETYLRQASILTAELSPS